MQHPGREQKFQKRRGDKNDDQTKKTTEELQLPTPLRYGAMVGNLTMVQLLLLPLKNTLNANILPFVVEYVTAYEI